MRKILENEIFYLITFTIFLISFFSYYAFISPGCEGGMDSYNHYLISRYCWQYPHLLLDQWGKPLYTILASPFANLGFLGVKIFNIILWLASAWLTWFTAKKLELNYAWFGFLLVIIPQSSIENTISGLTEYLNEFLLILFLFLAATKRWNLAAALCGLLPFARSEGFVIMAAAGFYLVFIEKQYKCLLWFLAGPILFNLIGWLVEGDILWIINNNPYIKAQIKALQLCGSGSLFHYAKLSRFIFSFVGSIFVILGTCIAFYHYFIPIFKSKKLKFSNHFLTKFMLGLVAFIFWLYFIVHSYIWWKGMMGSCGYTRVMIVITPLLALLGVYALHNIISRFKKYKIYLLSITFILIGISTSHAFQFLKTKLPFQISNEQKEFVKVAQWLKTQNYKNGMTYHLYAYLSVIADIDPYDTEHFTDLWSLNLNTAPVGSMVIWDGHFGPNECQLPLATIQNHGDYLLIKSFIPQEPFKALNGYPFEVHVFKRIKN